MLSSSGDIGNTKLIEIDKETDLDLLPFASKPYMFPLKHEKRVRNELEDLKKTEIILRSLFPYTSLIIAVPRKCPPASHMQETKRLCIYCRKLNAQLLAMLENKSSGAVTLVDIQKRDEMLAR